MSNASMSMIQPKRTQKIKAKKTCNIDRGGLTSVYPLPSETHLYPPSPVKRVPERELGGKRISCVSN